MKGKRVLTRIIASMMVLAMLLTVFCLPAFAAVQTFSQAFNPRGFFLTTTDGGSSWLRSPFRTGYYTGGGAVGRDELGHSAIEYTGVDAGLDYISADDIDTIYAITDNNPTPGYKYILGYQKNASAASLSAVPGFSDMIDLPSRRGVVDPAGGAWWSIPIKLDAAPGTHYEFAFQRGMQANNGTTCVLAPGSEQGKYLGYISGPSSDPDLQAIFDAHKYDEYEFITAIEGNAGDKESDHTITTVPMRYRVQTYADTTSWTEGSQKARDFLASVTEADINSGKYDRTAIDALRAAIESGDTDCAQGGSVSKKLQKDAEADIQARLKELQQLMRTSQGQSADVDFSKYQTVLQEAKELYERTRCNTGTGEGQYGEEQVEALANEIRIAESSVTENSEQVQVDQETVNLENAILSVRLSRIAENDRIFYDKATGIYVSVPVNALPDNVTLVVSQYVSGSTDYDSALARVNSSQKDKAAIYRILFFDGTNVVQPTEPVTVQIPLPDGRKGTGLFYLDDSGSAGAAAASMSVSGYQLFTTQTLGTYVLLTEEGTVEMI